MLSRFLTLNNKGLHTYTHSFIGSTGTTRTCSLKSIPLSPNLHPMDLC